MSTAVFVEGLLLGVAVYILLGGLVVAIGCAAKKLLRKFLRLFIF